MNIQSLQADTVSKQPVAAGRDDAKLKQACRDFEAIFITHMLKKMRQTVSESKLIYGGRGEEIFRDMQDEELSKDMSKSDGIGLAKMLYNELSAQTALRPLPAGTGSAKKEAR
jgi:peptidoglycan hydrolase FlgJ